MAVCRPTKFTELLSNALIKKKKNGFAGSFGWRGFGGKLLAPLMDEGAGLMVAVGWSDGAADLKMGLVLSIEINMILLHTAASVVNS